MSEEDIKKDDETKEPNETDLDIAAAVREIIEAQKKSINLEKTVGGILILALAAVIPVTGMFKMFEQNEQRAADLVHFQQLRSAAEDMKRIVDGKATQYTSSPYAGNLSCAAQVAQKALSYADTLKAQFSQEKIDGFSPAIPVLKRWRNLVM